MLTFMRFMISDGALDKYQSKHGKDKSLDKADEYFQTVKRKRGDEWNDESDDGQEDLTSKDIAKQPEGKGNNAGNLSDQLKQADDEHDRAGEIKEFFPILENSDGSDAKDLDGDDGGDGKGESHVEIGITGAEERHEDFFTMDGLVQANRADTRDQPEPVVGDNKEKQRGNQRKVFFGLFHIVDDAVGHIEQHLDDGLVSILPAGRYHFHLARS